MLRGRQSILPFVLFTFVWLTQCGGTGIDLSGESSTINNQNGSGGEDGDTTSDDTINLSSETVENDEVVQSTEDGTTGETNEDTAENAPLLGYVTSEMVYIDCANNTSAGDPEVDYVEIRCGIGDAEIVYHYYCTIDAADETQLIVSRDTDDDPVITDELFATIFVTCQSTEDGSPELFEEENIVS